jgi:hypothetical protein
VTFLLRCAGVCSLLMAGACGDPDADLADRPLNDLSDAELDALCEQRIVAAQEHEVGLRTLCMVMIGFTAADDSCAVGKAYCLDGAPPVPAALSCSHAPAESVTCEASLAELSCTLDSQSHRKFLDEFECDDQVDVLDFTAALAAASPLCPRLPPECIVVSVSARFERP